MTQKSALRGSKGLKTISPDRSSPIFCIADSLMILLWIVLATPKLGFWAALRSYHRAMQFEKEDGENHKAEAGDQIEAMVYLVLLCLGPMPQFLKLISFRGIPLTQACAWIYVISYLLSAITKHSDSNIPAWATLEKPLELSVSPTALRVQNWAKHVYFASLGAHILLWIYVWIKIDILSETFSDTNNMGLKMISGLVFIITIPIVVFSVLRMILSQRLKRPSKLFIFSSLILAVGVIVVGLAHTSFMKCYINPIFGLVYILLVLGSCFIIYALATNMIMGYTLLLRETIFDLDSSSPTDFVKIFDYSLRWAFALMNLSMAFIVYVSFYDGSRTRTSSWTNVFG
jgi:hypothetical protein